MARCPECGAPLPAGETCADLFNKMLALEWTVIGEIGSGIPPEEFQSSGPGREALRAHFFAVGTYQLQHPDRLEVSAVLGLWRSMEEMLAGRATREDVLRTARDSFDGPKRVRRRETARDTRLGAWPATWEMTVADVGAVPPSNYIATVRGWAETTAAAIRSVRAGR
jgi:hypothetical protein